MRKILAIDDKRDNLTAIEAVLKLYLPEYIVFTALSGAEGIKIAKQEQPMLILLDLIMPGMDGFAVCKKLKADKTTSNIPIIMITSRTGEKHMDRALEIGVANYMGKPYQEEELIANIQDAIA